LGGRPYGENETTQVEGEVLRERKRRRKGREPVSGRKYQLKRKANCLAIEVAGRENLFGEL